MVGVEAGNVRQAIGRQTIAMKRVKKSYAETFRLLCLRPSFMVCERVTQ